ncbi:hypothetical protein [Janibacter melonis]|uniref:hypothetical protein n=1 Tax=Janibacter melonis TaxID=262209 RepID=UPI00209447BB|nr:hypothetical protein [Janibacter melonis]
MRVADKEVNPAATGLRPHESRRLDAVVFDRGGVEVRMFEVDHDAAEALTPTVPRTTIIERTWQTYTGPLTVGEDLMRFTISSSGVSVSRGNH